MMYDYKKLSLNYKEFFENLNIAVSYNEYEQIFHENIYFKDPFQETKGIENLKKIFVHMYENVDTPYFRVNEIIVNENIAYLKWDFFYTRANKQVSFEGVSRIEFYESKVISHIDYWDAASNIYEKIPILKSVLTFIKRKLKVNE